MNEIFIYIGVGLVILVVIGLTSRKIGYKSKSKFSYLSENISDTKLHLLKDVLKKAIFNEILDIKSSNIRNPFDGIKTGYFKLIVSQIMSLGKTYDVVAQISNLKEVLETKFDKNVVESITIGRVMKLKLIGNSFDIIEVNEPKQFIIDNKINEWRWNVKPQKIGNHKLHLKISVEIHFDKLGNQIKDFTVHEKEINVKIRIWYIFSQFFINNWKWFLGAILGSGIIWKLLEIWGII